jgi:Big-like domain-containing protein
VHDYALPGPGSANRDMQQATVNLLADMGVQPATLQSNLVPAVASEDGEAPVAVFDPLPAPATGVPVTITGTASDVGGVPASVEISTDGGVTWHPATGAARWQYVWTPTRSGTAALLARATDDSANLQDAPPVAVVTVR